MQYPFLPLLSYTELYKHQNQKLIRHEAIVFIYILAAKLLVLKAFSFCCYCSSSFFFCFYILSACFHASVFWCKWFLCQVYDLIVFLNCARQQRECHFLMIFLLYSAKLFLWHKSVERTIGAQSMNKINPQAIT